MQHANYKDALVRPGLVQVASLGLAFTGTPFTDAHLHAMLVVGTFCSKTAHDIAKRTGYAG